MQELINFFKDKETIEGLVIGAMVLSMPIAMQFFKDLRIYWTRESLEKYLSEQYPPEV